MTDHALVYVIDDDDAVRDSLAFLLDSVGLQVRTFMSALAFLDFRPEPVTSCIISDIRMPEMDGLEMQRHLRERGSQIPLIFITGHGDVPIAVEALKNGAADFFEKPFEDDALVAAVHSAIAREWARSDRQSAKIEIGTRIDSLTPREREVLSELVIGNLNKVIAHRLGMSPRTVEVHRARVMEKMRARNLSELIRMVLTHDEDSTSQL